MGVASLNLAGLGMVYSYILRLMWNTPSVFDIKAAWYKIYRQLTLEQIYQFERRYGNLLRIVVSTHQSSDFSSKSDSLDRNDLHPFIPFSRAPILNQFLGFNGWDFRVSRSDSDMESILDIVWEV